MSIVGDEIDRRLGARVRSLRAEAGLTLDELAERSGVSRAMLSRVERATSSPTAQLLARLAAGLDVSLGSLFGAGDGPAAPLRLRAEQTVWRDPATGYLRRTVVPGSRPGAAELTEIEIPSGRSVSFAHGPPAGADQHVWLLSGALRIERDGAAFELEAGDCLLVRGPGPVAFHNGGRLPARYALVLFPGAVRS